MVSWRSVNSADNSNPAMIYLLDTIRLKGELQLRGLKTTGNKGILADRLQVCIFAFSFLEVIFLFPLLFFRGISHLQDAVSQERSLPLGSKVLGDMEEKQRLKRFAEVRFPFPTNGTLLVHCEGARASTWKWGISRKSIYRFSWTWMRGNFLSLFAVVHRTFQF